MRKVICEIRHLFVSEKHNFFGHHGEAPGDAPLIEVGRVECVAGLGIKGDRFFGYKKAYKGQITFFEEEIYEDLCALLNVHDRGPEAFRRNVLTRGVHLENLIGSEFSLQGVRFLAREECRPCYWMDQAFAPGAEVALKGRGGLQAEIVKDGELCVG
ncbi:MAG: MOSC domain-containing protein [Verrucomicrobia bacterium]|nr:MOSC domain-containing protein [Verrucomicrobiota bacterium]